MWYLPNIQEAKYNFFIGYKVVSLTSWGDCNDTHRYFVPARLVFPSSATSVSYSEGTTPSTSASTFALSPVSVKPSISFPKRSSVWVTGENTTRQYIFRHMATQEKDTMQFLNSIIQYAVFVQAVYLSVIIIANDAICQRLSHNFACEALW